MYACMSILLSFTKDLDLPSRLGNLKWIVTKSSIKEDVLKSFIWYFLFLQMLHKLFINFWWERKTLSLNSFEFSVSGWFLFAHLVCSPIFSDDRTFMLLANVNLSFCWIYFFSKIYKVVGKAYCLYVHGCPCTYLQFVVSTSLCTFHLELYYVRVSNLDDVHFFNRYGF